MATYEQSRESLLARLRERGGVDITEVRIFEMRVFTDMADAGEIVRSEGGKWVLADQREEA